MVNLPRISTSTGSGPSKTSAHCHLIDHGPAHADRVIALLDGLTDGLMNRDDDRLNPDETYILLAAAHLHALGLQDEQSEPDPAARLARYPKLGAELIYRALESPERAADLGLVDDPGLVEMIALTVAGHRRTDYPSPEYDDYGIGSVTVRPRLLAALLCLADGLDLDCRRVDLQQIRLMDLPPDEALDWWLHHYVSGVKIDDEYVKISYRLPQNAPGYDALLPCLVEARLRAVQPTARPGPPPGAAGHDRPNVAQP